MVNQYCATADYALQDLLKEVLNNAVYLTESLPDKTIVVSLIKTLDTTLEFTQDPLNADKRAAAACAAEDFLKTVKWDAKNNSLGTPSV